jgi:DNA topoisomerase VI subunit B
MKEFYWVAGSLSFNNLFFYLKYDRSRTIKEFLLSNWFFVSSKLIKDEIREGLIRMVTADHHLGQLYDDKILSLYCA